MRHVMGSWHISKLDRHFDRPMESTMNGAPLGDLDEALPLRILQASNVVGSARSADRSHPFHRRNLASGRRGDQLIGNRPPQRRRCITPPPPVSADRQEIGDAAEHGIYPGTSLYERGCERKILRLDYGLFCCGVDAPSGADGARSAPSGARP